MSTITLRIPDSKHKRLKEYAKEQGVSLNKLFEEFATVALAQFDAKTRFEIKIILLILCSTFPSIVYNPSPFAA